MLSLRHCTPTATFLLTCAVILPTTTILQTAAIAQVTPDGTLQDESSVVNVTTDNNPSVYTIVGGARRNDALFHSFDQFSVLSGEIATFSHANSIENIISRVTGGSISNLAGLIQAEGNANLFLINPAGIVISPDARLDIGGSFIATTGQGIQFANGFSYDTATLENPPLLTISAPTGLVMSPEAGAIRVVGRSRDSTPSGLSVESGKTLALIGGEILLDNVQLTAGEGRIELGSINEAVTLDFVAGKTGWDVQVTPETSLSDIQLANQSTLDVSGSTGGTIELQGQQITLAQQSALISDSTGSGDGNVIRIFGEQVSLQEGSFIGSTTTGTGSGSSIEIIADQNISLTGTAIANFKTLQFLNLTGLRQSDNRQQGGLFALTTGSGQAGDLNLQAQRIFFDEGITLSTASLGTGSSGDIDITATESLQVRGSGVLTESLVSLPLATFLGVATGLSTVGIPAGASGDINIETRQLIVEDGSAISASTLSDRNAGDITIKATESVILQGFFDPIPIPTAITTVTLGGTGAAGNVQIETGRLVVQEGAEIYTNTGSLAFEGAIPFGGPAGDLIINASESIDVLGGTALARFVSSRLESETYSESPAGTIQLTTPTLNLRGGGRITGASFGAGNGGAIVIDTESINAVGAGGEENIFTSGIFANAGTALQSQVVNGVLEAIPATGSGGAISIQTENLTVQKSAELSVGSFGSGPAGNLNIIANDIAIEDRGQLTATTTLGEGGNIFLTADTLFLDDSSITANAGRRDGGNLLFNLQNALLLRNGSLISTEAGTLGAGGNGGDITINIPDRFIIAVPSENSDIRANAFEGNGGNVSISARSLLGIAFRADVLDTLSSDITASSQFGRSGTVTINELTPNVVQTDIELPGDPAPPTLAQGCRQQGSQAGNFVITGRGGLPSNPVDPLSGGSIWQDLAPFPSMELHREALPSQATDSLSIAITDNHSPLNSLLEAQAWLSDDDGTVTLVTQLPEQSNSLLQSAAC